MTAQTAHATQRLLVSAAVLVAISSLLSRLLGLVRDRLFASMFGAGPILDAYFTAYRIPDLLFNLLILGTLSAAFLPVFSAALARGDRGRAEAFRIAQAVLTLTVITLSVAGLILAILAPVLVPLIVPGFDAERMQLTVTLTRIMLLQPILLGASSILSGMLNTFGRFAAYAAAPVLYNLGIILGTILLAPSLGILGVAVGVVFGALLHFAVQLPSAWRLGFRPAPRIRIEDRRMREIVRLMIPRLIGLLAGQVGSLIVTVVGSLLAVGSIAVYTFAENLQAVPIGLVGISIAVAAFPQLSTAAATNGEKQFVGTLVRSIRLVLFLILPLAMAMLLLRAQIVRVVLGTGAFDWEDTVLTLNVLGILAISVFAQSLIPLLSRAFFALHDTRTPMIASLASIALNVAGAWVLGWKYGVEGLALAFAASAILNMLVLLFAIHRRLGGLHDRDVFPAILKMAGAALVAGIVIQLLKTPIAFLVDMQRTWGISLQLFGSATGGILMYLFLSRLLGLKEFSVILDVLRRRPTPAQAARTELDSSA